MTQFPRAIFCSLVLMTLAATPSHSEGWPEYACSEGLGQTAVMKRTDKGWELSTDGKVEIIELGGSVGTGIPGTVVASQNSDNPEVLHSAEILYPNDPNSSNDDEAITVMLFRGRAFWPCNAPDTKNQTGNAAKMQTSIDEYSPGRQQSWKEKQETYTIKIPYRGCDDEECDTIVLSCGKNRSPEFKTPVLKKQVAADLVINDGGKAFFLVDGKEYTLSPRNMQFSDVAIGWSLTGSFGGELFGALIRSASIVLSVNGNEYRIVGDSHLDEFSKYCNNVEKQKGTEGNATLRSSFDWYWNCSTDEGESGEVRTTLDEQSSVLKVLSKEFSIRENFKGEFCHYPICAWGRSKESIGRKLAGDAVISDEKDQSPSLDLLSKRGVLHCVLRQ